MVSAERELQFTFFTKKELLERRKIRASLNVAIALDIPLHRAPEVGILLATPYYFFSQLPPSKLPEDIQEEILGIRRLVEEQVAAKGFKGRQARREYFNILAQE